jgi:hypothetical protein
MVDQSAKKRQRQPLEKPNQERGNHPINQGYRFEHPLNFSCLLKPTTHINSSINQVCQSKKQSINQVKQYNQPPDLETRSYFVYMSQTYKTMSQKTKSTIPITRDLS